KMESNRKLFRRRAIGCLPILIALLVAAQDAASPPIGYQSAKDAEQKKTLLLKDFKPVSMLHVPAHEIDRAKFYVIDVHNHVNDAARIDEHMPPERVVEVMDRTNVKTIVILTGLWGDKSQAVVDEMLMPYPGRLMVLDRKSTRLNSSHVAISYA